jgi:FemAB-related protein (PEP-CTERM system-associated)
MTIRITQPPNSKVQVLGCQSDVEGTWSSLTGQMGDTNLAQSPRWYTAIHQAYGHTPLYLQAENSTGQVAILPSFLVRSCLFGTVVTSMPFLDAGGPCSSSPALSHTLVACLVEAAAHQGAGWVELRCTVPLDLPVAATGDKVNLFLPLPTEPDRLWGQLDAKVRNQVRKAERSGLSVEFGRSNRLDDFYETFARNMRDLGSPVHSPGFFQAILDAFGDEVRIALVRKGEKAIGGLIALAFRDALIVPWASSLPQYLSLCPNMLLYWETLRRACVEGFRRFDFGRSSRNSGTYRFKRQWGALEEPLFWYTIPIEASPRQRLSSADPKAVLLTRLWRHLPLQVTRWLGPHVRKYLTQ